MDKSKMGYRDDSPFRKEPFIDISTPNGLIDMSGTGIPLLANGRVLPPYSGTHQFEPGIVRETPLMQEGDETKPEKRLSWKDWKTDRNSVCVYDRDMTHVCKIMTHMSLLY